MAFLTPGLPFIPAIAITVNIYLIFKLSILTLVRFTIWMTLGLIMYFYYGITHSSLENPTEEIELTVDTTYLDSQTQPKQKQNNDHHQPPTAVWDRHGYENKMAEQDTWSKNNYTTSWDINEANNAWNNSSSNNVTHRQPVPPSSVTKPKPPAPSTKPTVGSSITKKTANVPQSSKQQQKQQSYTTQPKEGFGSIFVDESEFPTWDD